MKIARIGSVPFSLLPYSFHFEELQSLGAQITIITSPDENFHLLKSLKITDVVGINIEREINIFKDILTLINLYLYFRKNQFDIIHSSTPKAGLLVAIAAKLAKCRIVIHTFTGQRWDTLTGIKKYILIYCDKLICTLNTKLFADSPSQVEFLIKHNLVHPKKISCLGKGSYAGILINKFKPLNEDEKYHRKLQLGFSNDSIIISFIGRIVKDKGIIELINAFKKLIDLYPNLHLLIVGPIEQGLDPIPGETLKFIKESKNIYLTGYVTNPDFYLGVSDIFCLPSHREGFGTVIIEAASMKIPSIGTNIKGIKDAIENNNTGLLFELNNVEDLAKKLEILIVNVEFRTKLGLHAYHRTVEHFDSKIISRNLFNEYLKLTR